MRCWTRLTFAKIQLAVLCVDVGFPLAHNPFKVPLANLFKQQFAITFNVLSVDDFKTLASFDQSFQLFLRSISGIFRRSVSLSHTKSKMNNTARPLR